jgi:hypothetical protein
MLILRYEHLAIQRLTGSLCRHRGPVRSQERQGATLAVLAPFVAPLLSPFPWFPRSGVGTHPSSLRLARPSAGPAVTWNL